MNMKTKIIGLLVFLLLLTPIASADQISITSIPDKVVQDHNFNVSVQALVSSGYTYRVIFLVDDVQIITDEFNISTEPPNGIFTFEIALPDSGLFTAYAKLERDGAVVAQDQANIEVISLSDIQQAISNLENEINSINDTIDQLLQDVENNTISINQLNSTVSSLSNELADVKSQLANITTEITTINGNLTDIWNKINNLQAQIDTNTERLNTLEQALNNLTTRVDNIEQLIAVAAQWADTVNKTLDQLKLNDTALEQNLNALNQELADFEHTYDLTINDIYAKIDHINDLVSDISASVSSLSQYVNNTKSELLLEITQQGIELRNEIKQNVTALNNEITQIKQDISSLNNKLNETRNELAKQEAIISTQQNKLNEIRTAFAHFFNEGNIWDVARKISDTLNELNNELTLLHNITANLTQTTNNLYNTTTSNARSIKELNAKLEKLSSLVNDMKTTVANLMTDYYAYKNHTNKELTRIDTRINEVQANITRLKATINELKKPQHISVSQEGNNLTVKVTTYDNEPVSNASVVISVNSLVLDEGKTNSNGQCVFNISRLNLTPTTNITITATKLGYNPATLTTQLSQISGASVPIPGFGSVLAVVVLLTTAYVIRKR